MDDLVLHFHALPEPQHLVIHYTSIANMFCMLDKGVILLYDSDNANDPNEGTFFSTYLDIPSEFSWARQPTISHAYTASFVIPADGEKRNDNLVYWRTYGREGGGCSLELLAPPSRVRKVLYGPEAVQKTRMVLLPVFEILDRLARIDDTVREHMATTVWHALGAIRYLYKDQAYEYENECRFVIPSVEVKPHEVSFDYGDSARLPARVRHYYKHEALSLADLLKSSDTSITFGPTVKDTSILERSLTILLQRMKLYGVKIRPSEIAYRGS